MCGQEAHLIMLVLWSFEIPDENLNFRTEKDGLPWNVINLHCQSHFVNGKDSSMLP